MIQGRKGIEIMMRIQQLFMFNDLFLVVYDSLANILKKIGLRQEFPTFAQQKILSWEEAIKKLKKERSLKVLLVNPDLQQRKRLLVISQLQRNKADYPNEPDSNGKPPSGGLLF
jgi:hypothetical protein